MFSKELYFSRFSNTCRRETSSFANFSNQSLRFTRYFVILTFIQLDFNPIKIRFHIFSFLCSQYFARNIAWTGMLAGVSDLVVEFSCKMIIYVCVYIIYIIGVYMLYAYNDCASGGSIGKGVPSNLGDSISP